MERYLDRGLNAVLSAEPCRVRFVESRGSLTVPDKSMHKAELSDRFPGLDIERLTQEKLKELGFVPQNELEREMLEFLNNPLIHKYPSGDSPARYFMEVVMGKHAVLASYLPPYSMTSEHPHSAIYGILEDYYLTGGKSRLKLGNEIFELRCGMSIRVPLNIRHQMITEGEPAFTLIIMRNAGLVDRKNWHR